MLKAIQTVQEGDLLDLASDLYADPHSDPWSSFPYEYAEVTEPIELEAGYRADGRTCVLVHTDAGSFGFAYGHMVRVPKIENDAE